MSETMSLRVNGLRVQGFEGGDVTQSMDAFATSFRLFYSEELDEQGDEVILEPGDAVEMAIGDDVLTSGFLVDEDSDDDAKRLARSVRGGSKLVDLVDCSATHSPTRRWRNATLDQIVSDLVADYDIEVRTDADIGEAFTRFAFHEGEKIADVIRRAAAARGVVLLDEAGTLVLARAGASSTRTRLERGVNILRGKRQRSWRARYSRYRFKGRTTATDELNGLDASEIGDEVTDPGVTRNRLLLISNYGDKREDLGKRAVVERNRRAGRSERLVYTVPGWRDDDGELWRPNTRVRVLDPLHKVDATLLIARTTHIERKDTARTELELTRPEAFDTIITYPSRARGEETRDQ